jgi:hypothetical protein
MWYIFTNKPNFKVLLLSFWYPGNSPVAHPGIFFRGRDSTNSVEDRERREQDLGAVAP